MKPMLQINLVAVLSIIGLSACNTTSFHSQHHSACQAARIPQTSYFVQLRDGSIRNCSSILLKTGVTIKPHLLIDGVKRYEPQEILAYQNKDHYAIFAGGFTPGGHRSRISVETLPGFAVKIAGGKLNVYVKKYKTNNIIADEYFLQLGEGAVFAYTPELMETLIRHNPEALDFFNKNRGRVRVTRQLKATAKIYNNTYFDELAISSKKRKRG